MKFIKTLLLSTVAVALAGCAGYQLGSTLPDDVQTVSLHVVNNTEEPQIEVAVMKALGAEVQMDGRLKLCSENEADAVLTVTLEDYKLNPLAFDDRRGSFAREYRIAISASSVLTRKDGEVVVETPEVLGESEFQYDNDLTGSKRAALPEAAADLARKAVSLVTTAW